jgi:erythromycin esterase-like protein
MNYKPMGSYLVDAYPNDVAVIGTFLYEGEYSAMGTKGLGTYYARPTKSGSIEELFHRTDLDRLMIGVNTAVKDDQLSWLRLPQVIRVIGAREGDQTYSVSRLHEEYDTIIFFDTTTATNLLSSAY